MTTDGLPYVAEFVERQRLAKLGFTSPLDELECDKAEAFVLISTVLDDESSKELKRKK